MRRSTPIGIGIITLALGTALIGQNAGAQQRGAAPAAGASVAAPALPGAPARGTGTQGTGPASAPVAPAEFSRDSSEEIDPPSSANSTDLGGGVRLPRGLKASSSVSLPASVLQTSPRKIGTFASQFKARVVSSVDTGFAVDQMALWPNDTDPTWLIACNEDGPNGSGAQRINIASGKVETIVKDGTMTSCDGVRRTPWGTVILSEEAGGGPNGGRVVELIDPLSVTNVSFDRNAGTFSGGTNSQNIVVRPALGRLSFEGFAVYANGVTYYGDESRPANGNAGGSYFKFVPATPRAANAGPITKLSDSPYAAGSIYGLQFINNGYGTTYGIGKWIAIPAAADPDLRAQALSLKLAGFFRPEDGDIDRAAEANGQVRFCYAQTGNEAAEYFGEVVCITDGPIAAATNPTSVPKVSPFIIGNPQFAMPDNVAYQPGFGNWVIHEDAETTYQGTGLGNHNDDLWYCADDGNDDDTLSDGCIRMATLNDLDAEWTGGIFDGTGTRFFVSAQHPKSGHAVIFEVRFNG